MRFRFDAPEDAQLGDILRDILGYAWHELGRDPRYIRFRYTGEDGATRNHEMNFN